jgi:hypothetical protein
VAHGELELAVGRDRSGASGGEREAALESEDRDGAIGRAGEHAEEAEGLGERPVAVEPVARLGEVEARSRYAGAMLLYPFFERLGAGDVLGALPGAAARRYDAPALMLAASFGFVLGSGSLEQTKHLHPADAGGAAGAGRVPVAADAAPATGRAGREL